jgi:hypothetical protein
MNRKMNRSCNLALLLIVALAISPAMAQARRAKPEQQKTIPPVTIVNNPSPEYRSGEVSVAVRGNENPIIRLGLAANGVTLVEFPASDRFFAINPGSTDLVTIEDSPTKETDHFFVIRAGTGFLPVIEGSKSSAPATSIIVQMSSGMVVTFLLYSVRDIERNAHRCVVTYDREAIIKARQAAGLATNLDRRDEKTAAKQLPISVRINPAIELHTPSAAPITAQPISSHESAKKEEQHSRSLIFDMRFPSGDEKWSKRIHGLKIAVQNKIIDAQQRQVLIAVHNTLSKPVQIIPGFPELYIHTIDDKGRVLHAESLKRIKIESASSDGVIAPGKITRYLITYEPPVLGARQRLGVAVAQTSAADEPAMMELSAESK